MKMHEFCLKFHWIVFLWFELKENIPEVARVMACRLVGSDNGLALATIIWANDG